MTKADLIKMIELDFNGKIYCNADVTNTPDSFCGYFNLKDQIGRGISCEYDIENGQVKSYRVYDLRAMIEIRRG